jgi:hypothetical protein
MMAAGLAAINQGAMLIWLTGLGTGADDLTWFFRTPVEQMVTKQRVLVVAPSCQTNTTWWPPEWAISTAQRAMTNDPEKTLAVGVVGLINGAYGQRHQQFNDLLVDAFQIAAYQTPMADIVQTAALAMGQIDQGYANGIIFFGAHVLKPNSASVDVAEQAPSSMRMLQAVPVGRNFEFRFSLNKAAQITLDVYDIQGRHVSSLASGTLSGGPHVYHWDTAGLASGIYLARLNQGSSTTGVKLVLVH